jgi:hypothetical protein
MFSPPIAEPRQEFADDKPTILVVDGHSTNVTPRVIVLWGVRKIILIELIPQSSHLAQPLNLWAFGLFKMISRREE